MASYMAPAAEITEEKLQEKGEKILFLRDRKTQIDHYPKYGYSLMFKNCVAIVGKFGWSQV